MVGCPKLISSSTYSFHFCSIRICKGEINSACTFYVIVCNDQWWLLNGAYWELSFFIWITSSTCSLWLKFLSINEREVLFAPVQVAAGAQEVAIFGAASETFSKWVCTVVCTPSKWKQSIQVARSELAIKYKSLIVTHQFLLVNIWMRSGLAFDSLENTKHTLSSIGGQINQLSSRDFYMYFG